MSLLEVNVVRRFCHALLALALIAPPLRALADEAPAVAPRAITVVMDDNYPPYIFRDDHGRLQGILKDTWALWSQKTGIPVNLQATDWNVAQSRMRAGQADVIDTVFITPERQKLYDFSAPYADIEVPIFFRNTISGIVNAESLKGFTVGVKAGDACINTLALHHITNIKPYPSYETLIKGAAAGDVVVFCIDKPPGVYFLYKYGLQQNFRYSAPLYVGQFHWAVRHGNDALKTELESGFAAISPDERARIQEKWMGSQIDGKPQLMNFQLMLEILVAIVLLLGMLTMWNRSLRRRVTAQTAELQSALHYLSATLAAIPDLLFEMDAEGVYHDYRANRADLLAAPPEKLLNHSVYEIMSRDSADAIVSALREAGLHNTSHGTQIRLELPGGTYWFELSVARKQVEPGAPARFIVLSRDITERKNAEGSIRELAYFDPLTRLPNRRALQERLTAAVAAARDSGSYAALMFIDIDNFKFLNDTRGHKVGDALLQAIAHSMQACLRQSDCLGRFGGDEFLVILEGLANDADRAASETEAVAQKLLASIHSPCALESIEYLPSGSIGIILFGGKDNPGEEEILKRADMAMYRAKNSGRNTMCFFDPAMQSMQNTRTRIDTELRQGISEQQFELYYQPQVDKVLGVIGAEALLRWHHPEHGLVQPAQFIAHAEESRLIIPLGRWVIERACQQLEAWQKNPATRDRFIAVNVSARQFQQPDFVHEVHRALIRYSVPPGMLKFEITESLVINDIAASIEKMHLLRGLGVRLSLDDFGTGYASLSYLKRMPLNEIKIDRFFMRDASEDHGNSVIVRTIISMAINFGLDVVAEGVETEAQREFLFRNGCRRYQGYLVSPPLPLAEFEARFLEQAWS